MRWFWQRRKEQSAPDGSDNGGFRSPVATAPVRRARSSTGGLAAGASHLSGAEHGLLRFASEYLAATGARVRVEDDMLLEAYLPSGDAVRYTTSVARARADESLALLVEGGGALTSLLDDCAERGRLSALGLATLHDAQALAASAWHAPAPGCGRCVGLGDEPATAGRPSCAVCPLHEGRPVLRWASRPGTVAVREAEDALSVEATFTVIARDRRGRTDEVVRVACDLKTGAHIPLLSDDVLASAQSLLVEPGLHAPAEDSVQALQRQIEPALVGESVFLRVRTADEYQRRVADMVATYERLRRESPDSRTDVDAMLTRELDALREAFSIEVDARLDRVCLVASPMVQVAYQTPHGKLVARADLGRGTVELPPCARCGERVSAGAVCDTGHLVCASCARGCGTCERWECPVCVPKSALAVCMTCGSVLCAACAEACATCGKIECRDHLWTCAGDDVKVCIACLELCAQCGEAVCGEHVMRCSVCEDVLCPEHSIGCSACSTPLCERHTGHCVTCAAPLCGEHAGACEECGSVICATDTFACLGCGRNLCACSPAAPCESCGMDYCSRCRGEGNTCPACRSLAAPTAEQLGVLALAAAQDATLGAKKKWQAGSNARAVVFAQRGLARQTIYVLSTGGAVLHVNRKGWGR